MIWRNRPASTNIEDKRNDPLPEIPDGYYWDTSTAKLVAIPKIDGYYWDPVTQEMVIKPSSGIFAPLVIIVIAAGIGFLIYKALIKK